MNRQMLIWTMLIGGLAGAADVALSQELPKPPADTRLLEFTGPDQGWPPTVSGATNVEILPTDEVVTLLTPAATMRLGELAASAPAVRRVLGDRFAFIEANLVEEDKRADDRPAERRLANATFYSYSRNVAVRALLREGEILEVSDVEGYQPPESPDEIERAVALARGEPQLREAASKLEGRALLTEPDEGQPGAGHRVLYVSFMAPGTGLAEMFALVDLTDNRVLEAGRVAGG